MFNGLKIAWKEVLKSQSCVVNRDGIDIAIPDHVFEVFEREFNLCFVELEDDVEFQSWTDSLKETR
jgi:hypothetical protein